MEFLHLLESLRQPWLDTFFLHATMLGDTAVTIAALVVLLWCVDKPLGFRIILSMLTATDLNNVLKITFRVERPFVRDPGLSPVAQALPAAGGYSFPSGHTQSASLLFGALGLEGPRRWLRLLGWALLALVGFSRMYLGVHTPADVLAGAGLSLGLLVVFRLLFRAVPEERQSLLFWGATALLAALLAVSALTGDRSVELVAHGLKNQCRFTGMMAGLSAAFELDRRRVRFSTRASLPVQGLKLLLGAATAGALFLGLDVLGLTDGWWAILGYAVLVFYAAGIYPMSFRWWTKKP